MIPLKKWDSDPDLVWYSPFQFLGTWTGTPRAGWHRVPAMQNFTTGSNSTVNFGQTGFLQSHCLTLRKVNNNDSYFSTHFQPTTTKERNIYICTYALLTDSSSFLRPTYEKGVWGWRKLWRRQLCNVGNALLRSSPWACTMWCEPSCRKTKEMSKFNRSQFHFLSITHHPHPCFHFISMRWEWGEAV